MPGTFGLRKAWSAGFRAYYRGYIGIMEKKIEFRVKGLGRVKCGASQARDGLQLGDLQAKARLLLTQHNYLSQGILRLVSNGLNQERPKESD